MTTAARDHVLASFALSPRRKIVAGDVVRFTSGGPEFVDDRGELRRLTLPGVYRIENILGIGRRVFLDVIEIEAGSLGARRIAFVDGRAYRSYPGACLLQRPYRVRIVRSGSPAE